MQGRGLVVAISNAELVQREHDAAREEDEAKRAEEAVETELAAYVRRCWEEAKRAKQPIEQRILQNLRQRNGEYDPGQLEKIKQAGQEPVYMMLTSIKCRAAKAWIRDTLMPAGDRPWTIRPAKEPELPEQTVMEVRERVWAQAERAIAMTGEIITPEMLIEVVEQAESEARKQLKREAHDQAEQIEERIEDQVRAGGWEREFPQVISDLVDFPAAIMKGPVLRRRKVMRWDINQPTVESVVQREVERVDPLRFYPAPGATDIDEGYMIELHDMQRSDLHGMIGLPGWNEDAIRRVLDHLQTGGVATDWATRTTESAVASANDDQGSIWDRSQVEALEFWGEVPGRLLESWGKEIEDPHAEYSVNIWLVGSEVVKLVFNPDPLGRKPYGKDSFQRIPGSFWGRGVPDLVRDCQRICNAAARAMVANMGIASGPQVALDTEAIPPGEAITSMYPWKIWQLRFDKQSGSSRIPIQFYQPNPMTDALMKVYEHFSKQADEQSGIPNYTYGSGQVGGAGRTASGLSMLMNSASKGIKEAISHIDEGITVPIIRGYLEHNMLYPLDDEDVIPIDVRVIAKGAMSLVAKEQAQMRRIEFLQQSANPLDAQIIGVTGRAAVLREVAKTLDMPVDDIVPDDKELQAQIAAEQAQQAGPAPQQVGMDGSPAGMPGDALQ